eukprot:1202096-Pleurochrysis_carterae.AAC.1
MVRVAFPETVGGLSLSRRLGGNMKCRAQGRSAKRPLRAMVTVANITQPSPSPHESSRPDEPIHA